MGHLSADNGRKRSGIAGTLVTFAALGAVLGWALGLLIAPAVAPALALGGAMTLAALAVGVVLLRTSENSPSKPEDDNVRQTHNRNT
ncbi:MAG: hypothetical protein AAGL89_16325 [Pseudomonadota bacterium]